MRDFQIKKAAPEERPDTRSLGFTDRSYRVTGIRTMWAGPDGSGDTREDVDVTITAEEQRRGVELADWWRECEYAGILGVDLPPPPPWHKPFRRITRIAYG